MITSIDAENIWQILIHDFLNKTQQSRNRGELHQLHKEYQQKPMANINNVEKL